MLFWGLSLYWCLLCSSHSALWLDTPMKYTWTLRDAFITSLVCSEEKPLWNLVRKRFDWRYTAQRNEFWILQKLLECNCQCCKNVEWISLFLCVWCWSLCDGLCVWYFSVRVCMWCGWYLCVCLSVSACLCVCLSACLCVCLSVCVCLCVCLCVCVCGCVCVCVCVELRMCYLYGRSEESRVGAECRSLRSA